MITPDDNQRQHLACTLKSLRVHAGLSTTQLANALGWSQSKVSKTELGRSLPPANDVDTWARTVGADERVRDELVDIASHAAVQAVEWRRELLSGRRQRQNKIRQLEADSSIIRVFSESVITGLAQTPPYMKAVFQLGKKIDGVTESIDDIVQARVDRQAILTDHSKEFCFVIAEAALHRSLIPTHEMRIQLQRLIELSQRPNVAIEVIPFNAKENTYRYHGFVILGNPEVDNKCVVLLETVTRGIVISSTEEVDDYIQHFEALRSTAIRGQELRNFLQNLEATTHSAVDGNQELN